jgi:hypothetical protein
MSWVVAGYPAKLALSKSEAVGVLHSGPKLSWLRPWAEHANVAPRTTRPWGYMHLHGDWGAEPVWDVVGFGSPEELAWGLELLFNRDHDWYLLDVDGFLNEHQCHGVFYWLPSDPRMLRMRLGVN